MRLGLDISTSIVGLTILDQEKEKIVKIFHSDLTKIEGIWNKVDHMKNLIHEINKEFNIKEVYIEEALSKFSRGKSSAHTISLLLRFNGILSYLIHQEMAIDPVYFSPSEARKICGLKVMSKKKSGGKNQKEQVFAQMCQHPLLKDYVLTFKRTGTIKDHHYDEIDSLVIALAGARHKRSMKTSKPRTNKPSKKISRNKIIEDN